MNEMPSGQEIVKKTLQKKDIKNRWQLLIKKEKVTIPKSDVENLLNFICSEINIAIECIDDKSYDLAIDKLYDLNEELEG